MVGISPARFATNSFKSMLSQFDKADISSIASQKSVNTDLALKPYIPGIAFISFIDSFINKILEEAEKVKSPLNKFHDLFTTFVEKIRGTEKTSKTFFRDTFLELIHDDRLEKLHKACASSDIKAFEELMVDDKQMQRLIRGNKNFLETSLLAYKKRQPGSSQVLDAVLKQENLGGFILKSDDVLELAFELLDIKKLRTLFSTGNYDFTKQGLIGTLTGSLISQSVDMSKARDIYTMLQDCGYNIDRNNDDKDFLESLKVSDDDIEDIADIREVVNGLGISLET